MDSEEGRAAQGLPQVPQRLVGQAEEGEMMIKASDFSSWDYCPRKFYFTKVQGLKTKRSQPMVRGVIKHEIFKGIMDSHKKGNKPKLDAIINSVFAGNKANMGEVGIDSNDLMGELVGCFNQLLKMMESGEMPVAEICEEQFVSEKIGLLAKPDAIFKIDGEWVVGDLKPNMGFFPGTELQAACGAMVFEDKMGVKVSKLTVISHNDWMVREIEFNDNVRKRVLDKKREIEDFMNKPSLPKVDYRPGKCNSCEFWDSHCKKIFSLFTRVLE